MSANDRQVGGDHYKKGGEEHWDRAWRMQYDPFQYIITKWVERWKDKGGVQDLEKAKHAIQKYIEVVTTPAARTEKVDEIVSTLGEVLPTGWRDYTFEGADDKGFLFTCRSCRVKVRVPPDDNPRAYHACGAEPGRNYVDQG